MYIVFNGRFMQYSKSSYLGHFLERYDRFYPRALKYWWDFRTLLMLISWYRMTLSKISMVYSNPYLDIRNSYYNKAAKMLMCVIKDFC